MLVSKAKISNQMVRKFLIENIHPGSLRHSLCMRFLRTTHNRDVRPNFLFLAYFMRKESENNFAKTDTKQKKMEKENIQDNLDLDNIIAPYWRYILYQNNDILLKEFEKRRVNDISCL